MSKTTETGWPHYFHPFFDKLKEPSIGQSQDQSQARIGQIHGRVRQLDAAAVELSRQRTALLRELNAIQPPIRVLPTETLSFIFQFVCPLPDFSPTTTSSPPLMGMQSAIKDTSHWHHMYLVLGQVSTYWRQILLSTPQLWTTIHLNISCEEAESEAMFLGRFLDRSGNLPLTLSFQYHEGYTVPASTLVHETVDAQLLENLPRTKKLYVDNPPPAWFSRSSPYLMGLTDYYLGTVDEDRLSEPSLARCPNIHTLTIFNVYAPIGLPSPCLVTILDVACASLDNIFQLLLQCPNLVQLYVREMNIPLDDSTPPTKEFVLKQLEELRFELWDGDGPWFDAFIDNIRLPSLRVLCWSNWNTPFSISSVRNFFANLPPKLRTLELHKDIDSDASYLADFMSILNRLHDSTAIEHLAFNDCNPSFVGDVLQILVPGNGEKLRFPQLRKITLDDLKRSRARGSRRRESGVGAGISPLLRRMLESRMDDSSERFTVELRRLSYLSELPLIQQALTGLRDRGYNIEIVTTQIGYAL